MEQVTSRTSTVNPGSARKVRLPRDWLSGLRALRGLPAAPLTMHCTEIETVSPASCKLLAQAKGRRATPSVELSRREDYELLPNLWIQLARWEPGLPCMRSQPRRGRIQRHAGRDTRLLSQSCASRAPAAAAGSGLTPNVAGALAYLLGFITGVLFLVIDPFKNDRFVRFHAFQSIFFNVLWIVFWILWTIVVLDVDGYFAWNVLHYPVANQPIDHGCLDSACGRT